MPRSLLFDFNGVVVNDEPQHCEALLATLEERDIHVDVAAYYREYLGFDDRECFRHAFAQSGQRLLTADDLSRLIDRKNALYETAIRRNLQLVPGVREFVVAAGRDRYRLAIVSGALRREIEWVLSETGLSEHFACIIAAEDVAACKPDPAGFRRALAILAAEPEAAMILEDSLPGLAAARAAGVPCTMLTTSYPRTALEGADAVWENFTGRIPADLPWANG